MKGSPKVASILRILPYASSEVFKLKVSPSTSWSFRSQSGDDKCIKSKYKTNTPPLKFVPHEDFKSNHLSNSHKKLHPKVGSSADGKHNLPRHRMDRQSRRKCDTLIVKGGIYIGLSNNSPCLDQSSLHSIHLHEKASFKPLASNNLRPMGFCHTQHELKLKLKLARLVGQGKRELEPLHVPRRWSFVSRLVPAFFFH